ncbi:MAG: hypothetical protein HY040_18755 [Planctomycetes bacterium]|nr:hypothetical protein [Planctomycetota bacterium]
MARVGIGLLVVAAILGFITYTEGTLAFQSSAQPEEISLRKLIERGPSGNAHILLTDFVLCDNLVHQYKGTNKDSWTHLWIPVVPIDEVNLAAKAPLNPNNVKALFFSINIRNNVELESRLNKPKVQALVTNQITSLESKIRNLLQQSYPGTDFDKCLIIQEGRTPFSRGIVYLFGGGAALSLLTGIGLFFVAWRGKSVQRRPPELKSDD